VADLVGLLVDHEQLRACRRIEHVRVAGGLVGREDVVVVGPRVEDEDAGVGRVVRVEREAEQALLDARHVDLLAQVEHRLGRRAAAIDPLDDPALLGDEQRPVARPGADVEGAVDTFGDGLEAEPLQRRERGSRHRGAGRGRGGRWRPGRGRSDRGRRLRPG
jgi:hypothetical protein